MPNGSYERPLAFNAITYLQDLTPRNGPLRIIPGSHLEPVTLAPEQVTGGCTVAE
jgi:ectoine hydroxylase-related dioxygenase (phytanoyl-CoA dioxygenase family)